MTPRIAIVGAGPGGLVLGRTLHRRGLKSVVFERDPSLGARRQGGSLDLHPETGQRALAAAGLLDAFWSIARPEGAALRIVDPTGTTLVERGPSPGPSHRPEVDRAGLRDLLLSSLPDATVTWGRQVTRVSERAGSGLRLHFADGGTENTVS